MKPSKANVKAHLEKVRDVIKANRTAPQVNLIRQLNPILRGWVNYHRHVVAKETFARNDKWIWSMLWQWAVRRHPNKGARWIKDKYFKTHGVRNWVFSAVDKRKDGVPREHTLLAQSDIPIKRHIKIKALANPHDPDWQSYFESRWGSNLLNSSKGRSKLYRVWRRQEGLCSSCNEPITKLTPWESSFIVKRTEGGTDAASNLRMHHLHCRKKP